MSEPSDKLRYAATALVAGCVAFAGTVVLGVSDVNIVRYVVGCLLIMLAPLVINYA